MAIYKRDPEDSWYVPAELDGDELTIERFAIDTGRPHIEGRFLNNRNHLYGWLIPVAQVHGDLRLEMWKALIKAGDTAGAKAYAQRLTRINNANDGDHNGE